MKSYGVAIQMKPLQQYFHMVLFIEYVVLTFESGDEILWCYHSDETFWAELLRGVISVFPTLLEYLLRFIDRPFCD